MKCHSCPNPATDGRINCAPCRLRNKQKWQKQRSHVLPTGETQKDRDEFAEYQRRLA